MSLHFHEKTEFRIENPSGKRKIYRIRYKSPDTSSKWKTFRNEEIDLANKHFLEGIATAEVTVGKLKLIMAGLYEIRNAARKKAKFMESNLAIVDALWEKKYPPRVQHDLRRPDSILQEYQRAARAAGMLPLDSCDLEELANYLFTTLGHDSTKLARRIVWINSILTFLGRENVKLPTKVTRKPVKYLTEEEYFQMRAHLKNEEIILADIAFYTGLRIGEIFFLEPRHIRSDHIYVEKQILKLTKKQLEKMNPEELKALEGKKVKLYETLPKSGVARKALLVEKVRDALKQWTSMPKEQRKEFRKRDYSKIIHRACQKIFPSDPDKDCCFHDLRHSNAIWLLSQEASIHEVAQHLGNLLEVTERFYSGFVLKEGSISRLKKLIDKPDQSEDKSSNK